MITLLEDTINTPLGRLCILCDNDFNLRAVEWEEHQLRLEKLLIIHYGKQGFKRVSHKNANRMSDRFHAYFSGDFEAIKALPTATMGTPFQQQVWRALRNIPCGQVFYYGQLAEYLGRPTAARAIGAANGANPISLVVPCHRVIGRDGSMTGYAGGIARKEWLLRHEGYLSVLE